MPRSWIEIQMTTQKQGPITNFDNHPAFNPTVFLSVSRE